MMKRYTNSPLHYGIVAFFCVCSVFLFANEVGEEISFDEGILTLIELDQAYEYFESKSKLQSVVKDLSGPVLPEGMDLEVRDLKDPVPSLKSSVTLELEKIVEKNSLPNPAISTGQNQKGQNSVELEEPLSALGSPDAAGTGNMAQVVESLIPLGSLGKLPLPIAKLNLKENGQSLAQIKNRSVGELGGTPYGPDFGKTTFGGDDNNNSFNSMKSGGTKDEEILSKNPPAENEPKKPELSQQIETLRQDMGKLAQKLEPFSDNNYTTYEKAKGLFKENAGILTGIQNVDPAFLDNAKELFVDHAWRDRDSLGKKAFEDFLERFEPKTRFPYPKGKEPRPKTHREGEIHLDSGRK